MALPTFCFKNKASSALLTGLESMHKGQESSILNKMDHHSLIMFKGRLVLVANLCNKLK